MDANCTMISKNVERESRGGRVCCVCDSNRITHTSLSLHRFPKDNVRCSQWIRLCGLQDLQNLSSLEMYEKYRLCSLHFDRSQYLNISRSRLKRTAVPIGIGVVNTESNTTVAEGNDTTKNVCEANESYCKSSTYEKTSIRSSSDTSGRECEETSIRVGESSTQFNLFHRQCSGKNISKIIQFLSNGNAKQHCCIVLPNEAMIFVPIVRGESCNELILRVLKKRGLHYNAFDIFTTNMCQPLVLSKDSISLSGKVVTVEKRVVFHINLPNGKRTSMKTKGSFSLIEAVNRMLHLHGIRSKNVTLSLTHDDECLDKSLLVADVENQCLNVNVSGFKALSLNNDNANNSDEWHNCQENKMGCGYPFSVSDLGASTLQQQPQITSSSTHISAPLLPGKSSVSQQVSVSTDLFAPSVPQTSQQQTAESLVSDPQLSQQIQADQQLPLGAHDSVTPKSDINISDDLISLSTFFEVKTEIFDENIENESPSTSLNYSNYISNNTLMNDSLSEKDKLLLYRKLCSTPLKLPSTLWTTVCHPKREFFIICQVGFVCGFTVDKGVRFTAKMSPLDIHIKNTKVRLPDYENVSSIEDVERLVCELDKVTLCPGTGLKDVGYSEMC